jgi:mannitol-specific phosphotransferase system IIBC component
LLLLLILIVAIVNTQSLLTLVGILGTIFALVTFIVCILWFALFKKGYEKKIEKYRQKIKEISEKEVKKRMALYERTKNQ